MSDPLYDRIFSISLTVIVGGEIGQKLRESYPIEAPWPWYSATWKTPFHIINNALVYVIFPFHLKDIVDANSLKMPFSSLEKHFLTTPILFRVPKK